VSHEITLDPELTFVNGHFNFKAISSVTPGVTHMEDNSGEVWASGVGSVLNSTSEFTSIGKDTFRVLMAGRALVGVLPQHTAPPIEWRLLMTVSRNGLVLDPLRSGHTAYPAFEIYKYSRGKPASLKYGYQPGDTPVFAINRGMFTIDSLRRGDWSALGS